MLSAKPIRIRTSFIFKTHMNCAICCMKVLTLQIFHSVFKRSIYSSNPISTSPMRSLPLVCVLRDGVMIQSCELEQTLIGKLPSLTKTKQSPQKIMSVQYRHLLDPTSPIALPHPLHRNNEDYCKVLVLREKEE